MMGRNHARVLPTLDGVELVSVIDENGDQHGVRGDAVLLTSLDELRVGDVDLAVVATPTSTHESTVLRLLDLGIHVLVEKPIADTAEAGRRMAQRAAEKNLVGAVGHIERFNPAIQELKMRLSSGDIGEVYQIATRRQGSFPARIGDVGVAKDLATHDIDLTAWIADSPYEFVFAQAAYKSGREHEDMISVTGRLRSGVVVNHLVNWLSPMKERVVIVTGDKGSFVADTLTGDLTLHENGAFAVEWESFATFRGVTEGNVTRFAYPKKEPLKAELEAFRGSVSGGVLNIVTFSEGVEVVRVAEAVIESASIGAAVRL
jgi:predicted dehydrogenase